MAVTSDFDLPTEEELTVPEVKLSGAVLRAAAFHLGKYCEYHNNEFMLCRSETEDIRLCVNEGKAVTSCTFDFFRLLKSQCADEFKTYYKCVDRSSSDYSFQTCRKTQAQFDQCMKENCKIDRPEYGYFCRIKIHETEREKPQEEGPMVFNAADLPQKLPDDYLPERPYAKYGSRKHFVN